MSWHTVDTLFRNEWIVCTDPAFDVGRARANHRRAALLIAANDECAERHLRQRLAARQSLAVPFAASRLPLSSPFKSRGVIIRAETFQRRLLASPPVCALSRAMELRPY